MGSKFGWLLAGLLVLVLAIFLIVRLAFPWPSDPDRTRQADMLKLRDIHAWPGAVGGPAPGGSGDAAGEYAQAAGIWLANQQEITEVRRRIIRGDQTDAGALPPNVLDVLQQIYQIVERGGHKGQASVARQHVRDVSLDPVFRPARTYKGVYEALQLLCEHYFSKGNYDQAEQVMRAILRFGWHLMKERGHVSIVMVGVEIQKQALGPAWRLYSPDFSSPKVNAAAIEEAKAFNKALGDISGLYALKLEIVHSQTPHPGDIFNLAENDEDHAWRVQATLALGLVKFSAGRRGDRKYANKLIERFVNSDDPLIAAAAKAAQGFTREDFDAYRPPYVTSDMTWPPGTDDR